MSTEELLVSFIGIGVAAEIITRQFVHSLRHLEGESDLMNNLYYSIFFLGMFIISPVAGFFLGFLFIDENIYAPLTSAMHAIISGPLVCLFTLFAHSGSAQPINEK